MGKSVRKKKIQSQDFKKVKLKVGKANLNPTNQTNTTISTKKIFLATQSIGQEKGEFKTTRNLTLKDLLTQLRHYAPSTRKDAFSGLLELFAAFPQLIKLNIGPLFDASIRLILDEDAGVRSALLAFLKVFLSNLREDQSRPFRNIVSAFTSSAMTHVSFNIRNDSLKFLDLWMELTPEAICDRVEQILPNFVSLLNSSRDSLFNGTSSVSAAEINARSTSSISADQARILTSLHTFLFLTIEKRSSSQNKRNQEKGLKLNFQEPLLNCYSAGVVPHELFKSSTPADGRKDHIKLSLATAILEVSKQESLDAVEIALGSLIPSLVNLWMECVPAIRSCSSINGNDWNAVIACEQILKIMTLSFSHIANFRVDLLALVRKHFMNFFPLSLDSLSHTDLKVEEKVMELNVLFCRLIGVFSKFDVDSLELGSVLIYLRGLFAVQNNMVKSIKADHVRDLMRVMREFLRGSGERGVQCVTDLFSEVYDYALVCSPTSLIRRVIVEAMMDFITDSDLPIDPFAMDSFIRTLPKTVWELKSSHPALTERTFSCFHYLFRKCPSDHPLIASLSTALIPFFYVSISKNSTKKDRRFGPFTAFCSQTLQKKVLETLFYMPTISEKLLVGVQNSLCHLSNADLIVFFLDTLEHRGCQMETAEWMSLLLAFGTGWTSDELQVLSLKATAERVIELSDALSIKVKGVTDDAFLKSRLSVIENVRWRLSRVAHFKRDEVFEIVREHFEVLGTQDVATVDMLLAEVILLSSFQDDGPLNTNLSAAIYKLVVCSNLSEFAQGLVVTSCQDILSTNIGLAKALLTQLADEKELEVSVVRSRIEFVRSSIPLDASLIPTVFALFTVYESKCILSNEVSADIDRVKSAMKIRIPTIHQV